MYNTQKHLEVQKTRLFKPIHLSKNASTFIKYIFFGIITLIIFIPILITLFAAFKTPIQLGSEFPLKPPSNWFYLENFKTAFVKGKLLLGFKNSMFMVVVTLIINILLSSMTAYCITRFDFKIKKVLLFFFMVGMVVPGFVTEIARFSIIKDMGLYNKIWGPIAIYAATDLLQIYIYMQFMQQIPVSLDESARIDGCNYYGIFWRIIFPTVVPATATIAILKTIDILNDMYIPYLYMPSQKLRTMTTALMSFSNARTGSVVELSACIILVMIPTILLFLFFQKYVFAGIVDGAVKE